MKVLSKEFDSFCKMPSCLRSPGDQTTLANQRELAGPEFA